jgi:hypothetical protein
MGIALTACGTDPNSPSATSTGTPGVLRGSFYLNGSADGSLYHLYTEVGVQLPCPERYCAWPSAVVDDGREVVFGAVWSRPDRGDMRVGLWIDGFAKKLEVTGSHPEVKRLRDETWAMVTAEPPAYLTARLWTALAPEGPWVPGAVVYAATGAADAAGFSVDYWCRDGGRWLLYMSGYPGGGAGSSMTLAESSRMEGPYSAARVVLSPGSTALVGGLPLLEHNLSPSSVFRDGGRWTMIGTGYGTTEEGQWYERTFYLRGLSAAGPWEPTADIAFPAPTHLASFENAEPATGDETCALE